MLFACRMPRIGLVRRREPVPVFELSHCCLTLRQTNAEYNVEDAFSHVQDILRVESSCAWMRIES